MLIYCPEILYATFLPIEQPSSEIFDFLRIVLSEIVKNAFFTQNHKFSQKNKNLSLEEHVLKELSISIDIFMFFSSFEVIVLILGGKVMTFVFYPLLRSQGIVKNWNTTE